MLLNDPDYGDELEPTLNTKIAYHGSRVHFGKVPELDNVWLKAAEKLRGEKIG